MKAEGSEPRGGQEPGGEMSRASLQERKPPHLADLNPCCCHLAPSASSALGPYGKQMTINRSIHGSIDWFITWAQTAFLSRCLAEVSRGTWSRHQKKSGWVSSQVTGVGGASYLGFPTLLPLPQDFKSRLASEKEEDDELSARRNNDQYLNICASGIIFF